jgi:acetoin utilization deacetylase AcuC-like enzyme
MFYDRKSFMLYSVVSLFSRVRTITMAAPRFATYLHAETTALSKPHEEIQFVGFSWPYFKQVRQEMSERLSAYPTLNLRIAHFDLFSTVHTDTYLEQLQLMAAGTPPAILPRLSSECQGMEFCLPGYQAGLGGMLEAIDRMRQGALDRAYCFSLGGHHAYADWGHGYCLLNPLAVAVRYAQSHGFAHVLIVDWDIHHGDGTQAIFAGDATVYCISIHSAADLYMAKACGLQIGMTTSAAAVGHCNIPVLNRVFDDEFFDQMGLPGHFYRANQTLDALRNALAMLPWRPDLICIFSGYDRHRDDCGAGITDWVDQDFQHMARMVLDLADHASCPVLAVHGGGYTLPVTLAAATHFVETFAHYQT